MDFTCAVWFEEALAHYHISKTGNETYVARLLLCITNPHNGAPPQRVHLRKKGQHWVGDHANEEFTGCLSTSIEQNIWVDTLQVAEM